MQPQLIGGRYEVLRAIGRGGMGTVWLCRDKVLGRQVAVKQIGAPPGESATETTRAMREARSAAALNHPNAVTVYDVVVQDERPWIVMEYVEGQTLADEISLDGHLSPQRVADIGAQLAGALARAHQRRIVHRDIKPGNVLIDLAGRPKISDFGIARRHGDDQLTQIGFVSGTPGYLSPELARGADPDSASDVWALGATLYAAVEGRPPYEPRSNPIALLQSIATGRPRPMTHAGALGPAIDAMMHEDPTCRWDMATGARRLSGIAAGAATTVMPRTNLNVADRSFANPSVADPSVANGNVTEVIGIRPVERTQRLESVAPDVVAPVVEQHMPAGPGKPHRGGVSRPPLAHLRGGAAGRRLAHLRGGAAGPRLAHLRGGGRGLSLVLVALLTAALGVAYLSNALRDQGATTAVMGSTTTRTTPARTSATVASKVSAPIASPAQPSRGTARPDPVADMKLARFVKSYYSNVTKDTDRTWSQLSPTMQDAAGGREGYDGFWQTIDKVKVNQTRASNSAKNAVVNLTFTSADGTTSTETHRLTFVTVGGHYLIQSERNLG